MPKHTITQEPAGVLVPGASKAWMSHFSPSSNGRIIRIRLYDNNYLAYHPELLCRLTEWHNLYGGACQHGMSDARYARWPCANCRYIVTQNSDRALKQALDNSNRKIAMVPGPLWNDSNETQRTWMWPVASKIGYPKSKLGRKEEEGEGVPIQRRSLKEYRRKRIIPGKTSGNKDINHLRFAHHDLPGKDDPVGSGRDLAFSSDVLPSDSTWQRTVSTGSGVTLVTAEEKELADLRKQGLLKRNASFEEAVTLNSVVRDDQPIYTLKLVRKRGKKGGKGKAATSAHQPASDSSEEQASSKTIGIADNKSDDNEAQSTELLSKEALDAMPEHCWADFLADMEGEGWVPVLDEDLASVAESWVMMESESEDSDGKT
ncbi:hypothetical protein V8F20_003910 [Naviculisporaceae sp. PSN 640]